VGVLTVIVKINETNTIFNRATKPFIVMMAEHISSLLLLVVGWAGFLF
jgi:hypothetical protein